MVVSCKSVFRMSGALLLLSLAACGDGGVSTAEVRAAAEERVREALGLTPESALFTNVYVGRPKDGDPTLCGTVQGTRADGTAITSRRFIAGTDPANWYRFERAEEIGQAPTPDFVIEWETLCAGEVGDNKVEPLAPTERGESK